MTMSNPSQHAIDAAHYILCGLGPSDAQERNAIEVIQHAIDAAFAELKCDLAHTQADRDAAIALVDMRQRECAEKDADRKQLARDNLALIESHRTKDQRIAEQAALISRLERRLIEAETRLAAMGTGRV